jgi:uncharacterized protein (TIGR02145 family)
MFKNFIKLLSQLAVFCTLLATTLLAQTTEAIALTGKVLDQNNNPVPFVEVELASLGLKDTTDTDGLWSISADYTTGILKSQQALNPIIIQEGILSLNLSENQSVKIIMMDFLGGVRLEQDFEYLSIGENHLNLQSSLNQLSQGNYLLKVQVGTQQKLLRLQVAHSGEYQMSPVSQRVAASISDKIRYQLQGRILDEETIASYQKYIEKFIMIRNVSGKFLPDPLERTEIDNVWANFTGGNMVESFVIRLGWIASNNSYSGKVYSVMPIGGKIFEYELYVEGRDSLGHKTTQSQTLKFDSYAGDLDVDDATTGNSLPVPGAFMVNQEETTDNEVSVNDVITINLNANVADVAFAGKILQTWFKSEGGIYRLMNTDTAQFVAPSIAQSVTWQVKMMDSDSNVIEQPQKSVNVVQDAPTLMLNTPADVSIKDIVAWVANATDEYGTIVQYEWDCDGSSVDQSYVTGQSTEKCVYATEGNYTVYSRVTDDDGNVVVDSSSVVVVQDLWALELNTPTDVSINDSVAWVVTPILDYGTIVQYEWDCDGSDVDQDYVIGQSTEKCVYATAGIHTVYSRVTDNYGNVVVDSSSVAVVQDMPTLVLNNPTEVSINDSVSWVATPSQVYGTIFQYEWDCDGSSLDQGYIIGQSTEKCVYNTEGSYTVYSRVTDDDGNVMVDSSSVVVVQDVWAVELNTPADVSINDSVSWVATPILDYGTIVQYEWDCDGSGVDQGYIIGQSTEKCVYNTAGIHIVYSRVTDDYGNVVVDSSSVTVVQDAPTLVLNNPAEVSINDSVSWVATPSQVYGTIVQYEWDCDGSSIDQVYIIGQSTEKCVYTTAGSYTVYSRVTDDDGNIVVDSSDVVVVQDMPTLVLNTPAEVSINDSVSWVATPSQVYGTIVQYEWDCDGSGVNQVYVIGQSTEKCVYATAGSYKVYSRVTDDDGNVVIDSSSVVVVQDMPTLVLNTPAEVSINDSVSWVVTPTQVYGTIVQYEWDCDGSNVDQGYVIGQSTEKCVYATAGSYKAYSRVTDDDSNVVVDSSSVVVVQDMPTIVSIDGPKLLGVDDEVTYTSTSSDEYGQIVQYEWDVGSGYVAGTDSLTHQWLSIGSKTIKLRVTDDDGNVVVDSVVVVVKNHFTDVRDGHRYFTTEIDGVTWMAENLAYLPKVHWLNDGNALATYPNPERYWVYDFSPDRVPAEVRDGVEPWESYFTEQVSKAKQTDNYSSYGVLYNLKAMLDGDSLETLIYDWVNFTISPNAAEVQGICPDGWHLPDALEWHAITGSYSAEEIMAKGFWSNPSITDITGLSIIPSGEVKEVIDYEFQGAGNRAIFWTSQEFHTHMRALISASNVNTTQNNSPDTEGASVRCVKDN